MWNIEELKKYGFACTTCLPHIGKKMDERFIFETGRKNLYVSGGAFGNERQKVLNPMDVYFNAAAGRTVQVRLCSGFRINISNAYTELGTKYNENEIKVLTINDLKKNGFLCGDYQTVSRKKDGTLVGKNLKAEYIFKTGRNGLYISGGEFGDKWYRISNSLEVYYRAAANCPIEVKLCNGFEFRINNACTELGTKGREAGTADTLTIKDLREKGFLCRDYWCVTCKGDGTNEGKGLKKEYVFKTVRDGLYVSGGAFGNERQKVSNSFEVYYKAAANCPIEVKLCNGFEFRINNACTELGTESREAGTADALTIKDLREKGFLCRDYELVSYSEDGSCSGINTRHEFVFTTKNGRLYVSEDGSGNAGQEVANPFEVYCKAAMHFGYIPVKLCNGKEFRINSAKTELIACGSPDGKKGEQK